MEDRIESNWRCKPFVTAWMALLMVGLSTGQSHVNAQTIYEIWTPAIDNQAGTGGFGVCCFRKKLTLVDPAEGEVFLAAKDRFELFINGQPVATGSSAGKPMKMVISPFLQPGVNVLAVRVDHLNSATAGLAIKFRVREKSEDRWRSLTSDESWKTQIRGADGWTNVSFEDGSWIAPNKLASVSFNPELATAVEPAAFQPQPQRSQSPLPAEAVGNAEPTTGADDSGSRRNTPIAGSDVTEAEASLTSVTKQAAPAVNANENAKDKAAERFSVDKEFAVQQVMTDEETGSLIAMAFNEFGQLILSQEGGPLLLADVTKDPGAPQRIRTLCKDVNSCQGILPLNGKIYVTGDGPSGMGLYRLADIDRDGMFEVDKMLIPFAGSLSEHGPHGIQLGPDGMIYVVIGNASRSRTEAAATSPYRHVYEGDLIPRVEDPGGHAVGVKAPGGTVIRTTLDGDLVETVSGGLRNIYDLAFDQHGELFLHDSDLESNVSMAWYRPTRIYHVPHGAELGWRSGWAEFPNYFADVTPPIADTGRGSPSGVVHYQHFQFPARYHNSFFFADWSEGRILSMRPSPKGAGYEGEVEVFVSGRPMNVTDLDVGLDGTLFFCTGGRGTNGGVYRISWTGKVPEELYTYQSDFERVIRMPQPNSAWGRQATAVLKKDLLQSWEVTLDGIASDARNDIAYRLRAIELLFFYGPFPGDELIARLASDKDDQMRARIASLCGSKNHKPLNGHLEQLLSDRSPLVRRKAAESWFRLNSPPPVAKVIAMLGSRDRTEAMVARRLLEAAPAASFRDTVLKSADIRVFIGGSIALLTAHPNLDNAYQVLARTTHFMDGYLNDTEFSDLLRVCQLALLRGNVNPSKIQGFAERMINEFPAGNAMINKQLAIILAYMKNGGAEERLEEYFNNSENSDADRIFVAMQLQTIGRGLSESSRFALIDYMERAILLREGSTYRTYIGNAIKELAKTCSTPAQLQTIMENGARWPNAMLQSFFNLRGPLTAEQVQWVIAADRDMADGTDMTVRRVRLGSIAVLAESSDPTAHEYLRDLWQSRPQYRNEIALGLAQDPEGANWAFLITSVPVLDDTIGLEVAQALLKANRRPKQPQQYRELIEMGYRLRDRGAIDVSNLMRHWTSNQPDMDQVPKGSWQQAMEFWTRWYEQKWPDELEVNIEPMPAVGNYTAEQVLAHLEQSHSQGLAKKGRTVFHQANCSSCHRLGEDGATFGPDLTNLASRFSRREVLESIIHPSRVVSDQYGSKKILTVDGDQLFGMLTPDSGGAWLLLDTKGQTTRIAADEIEEMADSDQSSMPDGLLDTLSLDEILDLFAYLYDSKGPMSAAQNSAESPTVR